MLYLIFLIMATYIFLEVRARTKPKLIQDVRKLKYNITRKRKR